ncbi:hypothetical protein M0804_002894 [Polistes exclamans]|nr:hypothetical protein M0804_002894 [Polistes exclamans]
MAFGDLGGQSQDIEDEVVVALRSREGGCVMAVLNASYAKRTKSRRRFFFTSIENDSHVNDFKVIYVIMSPAISNTLSLVKSKGQRLRKRYLSIYVARTLERYSEKPPILILLLENTQSGFVSSHSPEGSSDVRVERRDRVTRRRQQAAKKKRKKK